MKLITNIIRVVTGLLLIFSGLIKINDPVGFSLKLKEYFTVFVSDLSGSIDFLATLFELISPYSLIIGILICVIEIKLGIALLIGWKKNLTLGLLALLILFFTFLTWYSAYFNRVTDCGCFGNAIPLTPWESFVKDLILLVFISILIVFRDTIKPVFSASFSWKLLLLLSCCSLVLAFYCWYYLPIINFLKFKNGSNIEQLTSLPPNAKPEKREMIFLYTKENKVYEFTLAELEAKNITENPSYQFKERIDKVIEEGDQPEIHDFMLIDSDGKNHLNEFFLKDEYKLLVVSENLTGARPRVMKKLAALTNEWINKSKLEVWGLTAGASEETEALRHEYQLPFKFYFGDKTNLKSIIRSNPGLILFKKGTVVYSWPSTDLPSYKTLIRKLK